MVAIHGLNGDAKLPTIIYSRNDNRWMFCFGKLRFGSVHVLARSDDLSGDCSRRSLNSRCFANTSQKFATELIHSITHLPLKIHRENRFRVTEQLQNLSRMYCAKRAPGRGDVTTWPAGRQGRQDPVILPISGLHAAVTLPGTRRRRRLRSC